MQPGKSPQELVLDFYVKKNTSASNVPVNKYIRKPRTFVATGDTPDPPRPTKKVKTAGVCNVLQARKKMANTFSLQGRKILRGGASSTRINPQNLPQSDTPTVLKSKINKLGGSITAVFADNLPGSFWWDQLLQTSGRQIVVQGDGEQQEYVSMFTYICDNKLSEVHKIWDGFDVDWDAVMKFAAPPVRARDIGIAEDVSGALKRSDRVCVVRSSEGDNIRLPFVLARVKTHQSVFLDAVFTVAVKKLAESIKKLISERSKSFGGFVFPAPRDKSKDTELDIPVVINTGPIHPLNIVRVSMAILMLASPYGAIVIDDNSLSPQTVLIFQDFATRVMLVGGRTNLLKELDAGRQNLLDMVNFAAEEFTRNTEFG